LLEQVVDNSISKYMSQEFTPDTDSPIIYEHWFLLFDIAYKILTKWIKSQQEHFLDFYYYKSIEKQFMKVFKKLTIQIYTCDVSYIKKLKKTHQI